ncbi:MAG TPA: polyprenyl synthetase family protein, partial [Candidatus Bathyarchaeia archaeon]|nr:polyprenyl synthetase family protein [Candidatus Bathyarchaeia archaeon]
MGDEMLEKPANALPTADILGLRSLVNRHMKGLLSSIGHLSLSPQLDYCLLSPGKRLRPLIVLLSTYAVGGDLEKSLPLALSIEALHTATLVHDDAIDRDQDRRGVPTVHTRWGVGDAILVGDSLISLSISLAADYGREIVKIIANTGLELSDGEHAEASSQLKISTENQYYARIRGKSAALFRAAARVGALAGGGNGREVDALGEFGERFGLAYQIRDDIQDLMEKGSEMPRDLRNKVPTLPILHLYRNGDAGV